LIHHRIQNVKLFFLRIITRKSWSYKFAVKEQGNNDQSESISVEKAATKHIERFQFIFFRHSSGKNLAALLPRLGIVSTKVAG